MVNIKRIKNDTKGKNYIGYKTKVFNVIFVLERQSKSLNQLHQK